MKHKAVLIAAAMLSAPAAFAQDHAVSAKIGMLGLGVEYAHPMTDRLVLRGGLNGSSYGFDSTESGIDYAFDFNWDSLSVAADFHPTKGALRLTAGLLRNDNGLNATSRPSQDVTIGDTTYTPDEVGTLSGRVGFDSLAPFVGVGWDWSRGKHFGVALDLGVLSQGAPKVSLSATGTLLGDPQFSADLAAEAADLQSSLDNLDLLPFATLGFVFRF